jgi:ribosomal protein S18 acetylase RimI-like enzyme
VGSLFCWEQLDSLKKESFLKQISEIFFEASLKKTFTDLEAKENFFNLWCGQYIETFPREFWLMLDIDGAVLGYLCGCSEYTKLQGLPGYELFEEEMKNFPAHLHINIATKSRGQGVGRRLVDKYLEGMRSESCSGVFIITSVRAANNGFYERLNFNFTKIKKLIEEPLLFMGRSLNI